MVQESLYNDYYSETKFHRDDSSVELINYDELYTYYENNFDQETIEMGWNGFEKSLLYFKCHSFESLNNPWTNQHYGPFYTGSGKPGDCHDVGKRKFCSHFARIRDSVNIQMSVKLEASNIILFFITNMALIWKTISTVTRIHTLDHVVMVQIVSITKLDGVASV